MRILLLILTTLLLGACSSRTPETRFYVLTASANVEPAAVSDTGIVLGLGPIELPDYLDRPQIVTRRSEHELDVAEFARWGEPLEDGFASVLSRNLKNAAPVRQVLLYPWRRSARPDYQLTLEVQRFEVAANMAFLTASWNLLDPQGNIVTTQTAEWTEPVSGRDYAAMVAALSRLLAHLGRQIGGTLSASNSTSGDYSKLVIFRG